MNSFENEHTYSLILSAQNGDEKAKSQITEENLKLVYSVAKRFYNRGYDDEDINQIVLNTTSSEAAFLASFDNTVSEELNDIIYGTDTTNS